MNLSTLGKLLFSTALSSSIVLAGTQFSIANSLIVLNSNAHDSRINLARSTHFALLQRKDWEITKEGTDRKCTHSKTKFTYHRHKTTQLWWSKDAAGHGTPPSAWKVYDEKATNLVWRADADRYGDFIPDKHKGPTGLSIPFSELNC